MEGDYKNVRLVDYKSRSWKNNQESRRSVLLQEQKKRREDSFNLFRDFHNIFTVNDDASDDSEDDSMDINEVPNNQNPKSETTAFPKLKELFMFSEWMTELPDDLQTKWIFIPCPVGKRCLVRSTKGFTTVFGTRGYQLTRFRSSLPNGGFHDYSGSKFSKTNVTVLDCIWNSEVQKYFVLDILYWKSQSYLDTDIMFRSFWTKSKIEETRGLSERSKRNPYPFVPLNHYPCDTMTMSSVMSKHPFFESDKPKLDGVLFYHSEGYYTPGVTPLVLWLKPFMLPEVMEQDVCVSEEYFRTRSPSYTNMFQFIEKYEKHRKENIKKRRWKKGKGDEKMEICGVDDNYDFEFE